MKLIVNIDKINTDIESYLWLEADKAEHSLQFMELANRLSPLIHQLLAEERIGEELLAQLNELYLPLAKRLADWHKGKPIVIGINGAPGSGKSTLNKILKTLLHHGFNKSVLTLSIDDLYLSLQRRKELAREVHPLFKLRGVPGTHDVNLAETILSTLLEPESQLPIRIPVFDKASDDLLPQQQWPMVVKPVEIILFEGWCVGAKPEHPDDVATAMNELECTEDAEGVWREYVNEQLHGPYQSLFSYIDYMIMLKVPDMESIQAWRQLQEEKLATYCTEQGISPQKIMSTAEISRFLMLYERTIRNLMAEMPSRADILLELNREHQIDRIRLAP